VQSWCLLLEISNRTSFPRRAVTILEQAFLQLICPSVAFLTLGAIGVRWSSAGAVFPADLRSQLNLTSHTTVSTAMGLQIVAGFMSQSSGSRSSLIFSDRQPYKWLWLRLADCEVHWTISQPATPSQAHLYSRLIYLNCAINSVAHVLCCPFVFYAESCITVRQLKSSLFLSQHVISCAITWAMLSLMFWIVWLCYMRRLSHHSQTI